MSSLPHLSREVIKKPWFKWLVGALVIIAVAGVYATSQTEETVELIVEPTTGPFRVTVTTAGDLRAKNSVEIMGPAAARNLRLPEITIMSLIPEGTVVERGDFVAELDRSGLTTRIQDMDLQMIEARSSAEQTRLDTLMTLSQARDQQVELRYAMEEARLQMELSRFESESVKRQVEIDYEKAERAYEQSLETYETQVKQAQAQMRAVNADLTSDEREYQALLALADDFTVLAPSNGMVIYHRQRRGERIQEGSTISSWEPIVAELPDLSIMESVTFINEVDFQKIKVGQQVEVGLDADPDTRLTGTVTRVANVGEQRPDSDAKVFEVVVQINQSDSTLRPAMTTSNTIIVAEIPEALQIPLETIHTQDSLNFVFLRTGGGVVRQEILLGLLNENNAVVLAGVEDSDRLYLSMPADTSGLPFNRLDPSEIEQLIGQPEVLAMGSPAAQAEGVQPQGEPSGDAGPAQRRGGQRPQGERPGGGQGE